MGRRGLLRPPAPGSAGPTGRERPAGLVAGQPGLGQRPGEKGGALTGPNPTDRGKAGSKYHLLVDATGLPLNVLVSAANRHDSLFVEPILDSMPAIKRGGRGHPRRRPVKLHGDKGYDNRGSAATCAAAGSPPGLPGSGGTPAPAWAGIA